MTYFRDELVQLIVSRIDSEQEVWRYGMKKNTLTVECWSYHAARWTVNETTWKTVPKPPKSVFENRTAETEFSVFEFWGRFGSVRFLENQNPKFSLESAHPEVASCLYLLYKESKCKDEPKRCREAKRLRKGSCVQRHNPMQTFCVILICRNTQPWNCRRWEKGTTTSHCHLQNHFLSDNKIFTSSSTPSLQGVHGLNNKKA